MQTRILWVMALCSVAAPLFAADELFLQEVSQRTEAEVAFAQLAATKGSTGHVRSFGDLTVGDLAPANAQLRAVALKSGVALPTYLTPEAKETQKKLESLSGSAFDLAYLESQSQTQAKTVRLLEEEIANGVNPFAIAWARNTLPMVKRHAEMVGALGKKPGEHDLEHAAGISGAR